MIRKYVYSLLALFFILGNNYQVQAQDRKDNKEELSIQLQLRPRAEIRNGLFTPILEGQKAASFIAQRSRISLLYSKNQHLKMGFSTQMVNTWGNDPQVQPTANDVSVYEAWAQLYFNPEWNVKLGRQILSYDDERLLGALDWNNSGRKHDAAVIGFEKSKFKLNVGLAFNQNSEKVTNTFFDNTLSQPYKSMHFVWLKYQVSEAVSFSAIGLNLQIQNKIDSSVANLFTGGGNLFIHKDKWNIQGTYYFQFGNKPVINSAEIKTSAWMTAIKVGYQVDKKWTATIGSDYLSGRDMNTSSTTITSFDPLYATGHKFYGSMDYFYVSSAHQNVGLWDSYIGVQFKPSEKIESQLTFHHFEAAAKVVNSNNQSVSKNLGNEVDWSFNYSIMDDVKMSGGYSQMFTNSSMKNVKNIANNQTMKATQNWFWLSFNFNPRILLKLK
ncbi:MAG: alginate export family protein [Ginsengibacter sp.]|jgi:hypothetical protein